MVLHEIRFSHMYKNKYTAKCSSGGEILVIMEGELSSVKYHLRVSTHTGFDLGGCQQIHGLEAFLGCLSRGGCIQELKCVLRISIEEITVVSAF